ncbi:hypothetical protein [Peptacetobacter hiranonis]|uniref:hypothetical protein n=1 Tax=Peptacetobacter hiranonis TaxID=89152 RepID=UPI0022E770ED|nr:hypothetical protein [Peptacetobacter hiranonis]
MRERNIFIYIGIVIYIIMSGIDRFVYHIPNMIYIPIAILGIALILIGFFKDKKDK